MKPKQIIAMGGGGFSMEPDNPLLDQYVLQQTGVSVPKVCFVGTASGDAPSYIERFYDFFNKQSCEPSHLSLFKPPSLDLESYVLDKDVIYVGGGNTRNLLALWREWELDRILKKAWEQGIVLAGISAGAICWFEEGCTDSLGNGVLAHLTNGVGLLSGSMCPHYDGEELRRPSYQGMVREDILQTGYAADDGAALHFIGNDLHQVITSRPHAAAYRVSHVQGRLVEEQLPAVYLGREAPR